MQYGWVDTLADSEGKSLGHDEDLREPLVRRQGRQVSMRVARGSALLPVVPVPANPGQLVMADLPGVGLLGLWVPQRPWSQLGWCCVPMPLLLRIARISYVVFRHTMWRWLQGSPGRRRSPHLPSLLPLDRPPACCLWEEPGPALLRC